jgi:large subunit ribosomal protein L17
MFRNMVTSLMVHGQIQTTEARAKELRRLAERVISISKRAPSEGDLTDLSGESLRQARADRVTAIRRAKYWVHDQEALHRLFGEYRERFAGRPGGYTRVIKAGRRPGDNAPMAYIQLVGEFVPAEEAAAAGEVAEQAAPAVAEAGAVAEVAPSEAEAEDKAEASEEE